MNALWLSLFAISSVAANTIDTSLLQRDTIGQSRGFDFVTSMDIAAIQKGYRISSYTLEPPGPPSWPTEWAATMTQMDLTTNQTGQFNLSQSLGTNATLYHFLGSDAHGFDILTRQDEDTQQTLWPSVEGLQCQEGPIQTPLVPVPVEKFAQNGTISFLGELLWVWISPPLLQATEQTLTQPPRLLLNGETKLLNVWSNFQPLGLTSWPLTTFLKPSVCQTMGV